MFDQDNHIIFQACTIWANYIETGEVINPSQTTTMNELSASQTKLVERLRELSVKALNNDINLKEG